jgi:hypothetical protein
MDQVACVWAGQNFGLDTRRLFPRVPPPGPARAAPRHALDRQGRPHETVPSKHLDINNRPVLYPYFGAPGIAGNECLLSLGGVTPNNPSPPQPPGETAQRQPSRSRFVFAVVTALVVLPTGFVLLGARADDDVRFSGEGQPSPARSQVSTWTPRGSPALVQQAPPEQDLEEAPDFDATTCWRDVDRFNAGVTFENFREWSTPLRASGDALIADYLKERLQELIGQDVNRAHEVLVWARESSPEDAALYLSALSGSEAVHLPQVAGRLTEMSLDERLDPARRTEFLSALSTQKHLAPEVIERLAAFARKPEAGEAGWTAVHTLGTVMEREAKGQGNVAPYLDSLLTLSTESPDEQIRDAALTLPMHTDVILDAPSTERYANILVTEGGENGRSAAAHNLALSKDKQKVLDVYAQAFVAEPSVCVRWALFRFSARAAGKDALPVMARMALADPRFQPDYQDFERIYASGIVDFERVWLQLPQQDPHDCFHREDE